MPEKNCVVPENILTPHGGFFQFDPPPPWIFRSRGSGRTAPHPLEIPRFCHLAPYPVENPFLKKKRDSGHLYLFYHHLSKVSKCAVQVDENIFRGTFFTETLS